MKRPSFALAILAAVASTAVAPAFQSGAGSVADRIARLESQLLPPVTVKDQTSGMPIAERMRHYSVPGVSVAVINNGTIEWAKGYGVTEAGSASPVTAETLFQAASISKPVAAMGMLALVEQGKLALDEDINLKLKSWKLPENDFTKQKAVTLRQLSSHSAGTTVHGFRGYAEGEAVPSVVQILDGAKPANSAAVRVDKVPGSSWRYSGGGITAMQLLMTDVAAKPFPVLMKELVFDKLGMKSSTYDQPLTASSLTRAAAGHLRTGVVIAGKRYTHPEMAAAGLWTTPTDLATFAIELQRANAGKSRKVLSQAMVNQMLTKQSGDYGLGIGLGGSGQTATFSHGGSNVGFKCTLFAYIHTGQGAVIMTNGDQGPALANEILRSISREYGWTDYKTTEVIVVKVNPDTFKAYVGDYDVQGRVSVTTESGKLYFAPPGQPPSEAVALSETEFQLTSENVRIKFMRNAQGAVDEILVHFPNRIVQGKRVK